MEVDIFQFTWPFQEQVLCLLVGRTEPNAATLEEEGSHNVPSPCPYRRAIRSCGHHSGHQLQEICCSCHLFEPSNVQEIVVTS
ncbi:hypothetical protein P3L10_032152 [Capsicum annuum]